MFGHRLIVSVLSKRNLYRRRSDINKDHRASASNMLKNVLTKNEIKCAEDWTAVRKEVLELSGPRGQITPVNIDAMTVGACTSLKKYDLAFSYLDFLEKKNIKPNLATVGKLFKLLAIKGTEGVSQDYENRILELYQSIRKSHPVLDATTLDSIIQALSTTKDWRVCLDLINEVKISATPTSNSFSSIIATAFLNNAEDVGWKLLNDMLETGLQPLESTYFAYFKMIENMPKREFLTATEKMFYFLQNNQLIIKESVAKMVLELCEKKQFTAHLSAVNKRGQCEKCKASVQKFDITENEFDELKQTILDNIIVGKNVFNKSTSEELQTFKQFISTIGKFDVVLDGLNIAYSVGLKQPSTVTSALVAAVVSYFVDKKKDVLLLGRKHMNKWPKQNWNYINKNATVFLTQDMSQDDPYLLYCALHSGKNTIIVTKDLMRGHKFLLKKFHLKLLFDRWLSQRQHQLILVKENGRKPIFKIPPAYTIMAQKQGDAWHVPYERPDQDKDMILNTWLCLKC